MNDFNLNLFKYFYYVAYYNGFTNASQKLKIAQPSLSYNVKMLEQELNYQLISRKNKKFQLTEKGNELYQTLKYVFDIMENNINIFSDNVLFEEITIGIRHHLSDFLLAEIINTFYSMYPNIHLNIKLYSELEVEKFNDAYDIIIDYKDYTKLIETDNRIILCRLNNIFMCGRKLFDQYKAITSIRELDNSKLISLNPSRKKGKFQKYCFKNDISFIEILSINESSLFNQLIQNNFAIGYGCEKALEPGIIKGDIKKIPLKEILPEDEIELIYKNDSKNISNFIKIAIAHLKGDDKNE